MMQICSSCLLPPQKTKPTQLPAADLDQLLADTVRGTLEALKARGID